MNIYEKLSEIQMELKCPKSQYNSFGKFRFRSCEDILEAVKPLCHKHKTTLILTDEIVEYSNGNYIEATAKLFDHESDGSVFCYGYAREDKEQKGMSAGQLTGATSSYARKYALNRTIQHRRYQRFRHGRV